MSNVFRVIGACLGLMVASSASASFIPSSWSDGITDFSTFGCGSGYLSARGDSSCTYQHNITDGADGFDVTSDYVTDFVLRLNLRDDHGGDWAPEWAFIDLPGILGDVMYFDVAGPEFGGVSLAALLELNIFGTLTVTVESIVGDFRLAGSSLTASGYKQVPEPATLGLLGLGLLGMGLARRRRAS